MGEGGLALLGGESLGAVDMVGDRADAQRTLVGVGGVGVEPGGLHLDGESAHAPPAVSIVRALGGIEGVVRDDVADLDINSVLVRGLDGLAQKSIVRDGGEGAGAVELVYIVGVCACALQRRRCP